MGVLPVYALAPWPCGHKSRDFPKETTLRSEHYTGDFLVSLDLVTIVVSVVYALLSETAGNNTIPFCRTNFCFVAFCA